MEQEEEKSFKEQRIRRLTNLYYSKPEVQKAIFEFSKSREICPRYFEGFGKRPDMFQYESDIFELAKKGATSFHCSEELWSDPLTVETGMNDKQLNGLRKGWDLLIDIDSKYIDYSKISAKVILDFLKFHGIKNFGIKFSVSGDTPVLIRDKKNISLVSISKVIGMLKEGRPLDVLSLDKRRKLKFSKIYDFLEHPDTVYELQHSQSTLPLRVTKHHSVFIWDKGEIIEKKVNDLKKGDFLISFNSKQNPLITNKTIEIKNKFEFGSNQFTKKTIENKVKLSPELMRLIGYFLAEGHVTNIIHQVGFAFNKNETEYIEDVKHLLEEITHKKISTRHPNSGSTQILIHSKEWAAFFDNYCGKKKDKHVPDFSWKLPKGLFYEMLRGYIRGDGYKLGKYGIVVKSVSKKLITELLWLCKLNNISANISKEQGKPHKLPQGNLFKGSLVYLLRIPKSELGKLEFKRARNKFSPFPGDKTFPIDGLKEVYKQIKPKMFNYHRAEQMTLKKKKANLIRIRKVLDWFYDFQEIKPNYKSKRILNNYEKLFDSDISVVSISSIAKKEDEIVYDVSVKDTESFFGNYYPLLLHNSGSKGFHIIVPWKAFPKEINGVRTSNMFPEWPRIISRYITEKTKPQLINKIAEMTIGTKYVKDFQVHKEVMPDIILVSPRHLFRVPYSLHEKTSMASVVITESELENFQIKDANPLTAKIRNFMPNSLEGEATRLLVEALDWWKDNKPDDQISYSEKNNSKSFEPIKIENLSDTMFPPSIKKILEGVSDGRKRAAFILINFFRSIGLEKNELEKRVYEWNEKNEVPLKQGYIKSQISWSYRNKIVLPPNFNKDYYKGIGIIPTPEELRFKNPVNYMLKQNSTEDKNYNKKTKIN